MIIYAALQCFSIAISLYRYKSSIVYNDTTIVNLTVIDCFYIVLFVWFGISNVALASRFIKGALKPDITSIEMRILMDKVN